MANEKAKSTRAIVMLPVALKEQVRKLANAEDGGSIALITRRALKRYVESCPAPEK